ncbi:MAG: cobalamin-independent methionine synthase II family protein [Firmicutes bacterium]|nr:cobalamin-independent methionine synthase II family protein [Ezakiella sp.]MDD7761491.1 cobalamin-independent methionine synthase II family protein [Bacillota bacterium]
MLEISLMGSMPRTDEVLRALRLSRTGKMSDTEFYKLIDEKTSEIIKLQEEHGVDYITSGELHRDNYVSFISNALDGVRQMSMSEMLDYVEDKKAFEQILNTLDVPAIAIKNAICTGKIARRDGIVVDELKRIKKFTDKKIKITLPGPYLVTRSMWLPELSKNGYDSKEELGEDVIKIYQDEIEELQELGVDIIQFDEPVLTEVVFTDGRPRTFMCAALSERKDPTEELEFATHLIKSVISKVDKAKSKVALHVCRGNWSKDETILLEGPYTPLLKLFSNIDADILFLEFSTDRAGEIASFYAEPKMKEIILGLGVVNPRLDEIESVDFIVNKIREAEKYQSLDMIMLNPDCGFATFANRPVNTYDHIKSKLDAIYEARKAICQR